MTTINETDLIPYWVLRQYGTGWNPVPFDTVKGTAVLPEYKPYRTEPPTISQIKEWMPLFVKYGVAQITGYCFRGKFEGLCLNCVDIDSPEILNRLLEIYSLEQLAKDGIFVEQHYDNKGKAHLWILSTKPFETYKSAGLEVKARGMLCNSYPSFNKGGYRYFPVGDSLKIFNDDVEPIAHDNFIHVINKLTNGEYLNGKAKKNTSRVLIDEDDSIKWHIHERYNKLLSWGCSKCLKHKITELDDIRALIYTKDCSIVKRIIKVASTASRLSDVFKLYYPFQTAAYLGR